MPAAVGVHGRGAHRTEVAPAGAAERLGIAVENLPPKAAAGNADVERLARTLQAHARTEEDVSYPAAVLVGRVVRLELERER